MSKLTSEVERGTIEWDVDTYEKEEGCIEGYISTPRTAYIYKATASLDKEGIKIFEDTIELSEVIDRKGE